MDDEEKVPKRQFRNTADLDENFLLLDQNDDSIEPDVDDENEDDDFAEGDENDQYDDVYYRNEQATDRAAQQESVDPDLEATLNNPELFQKPTDIIWAPWELDFVLLNGKVQLQIFDQPAICTIPLEWGTKYQEGLKGKLALAIEQQLPPEPENACAMLMKENKPIAITLEILQIKTPTNRFNDWINVAAPSQMQIISAFNEVPNQYDLVEKDERTNYLDVLIVGLSRHAPHSLKTDDGIYFHLRYRNNEQRMINAWLQLPIYNFGSLQYQTTWKRLEMVALASNNTEVIHQLTLLRNRAQSALQINDFQGLINHLEHHLLIEPIPMVLAQRRFADGQVRSWIAANIKSNFHYLNASPTLRKQNHDWLKIKENLKKYQRPPEGD